MDANDPEGREWLGVVGAGAIAAVITALATSWPAQGPSAPVAAEISHAVAAGTPEAQGAAKLNPPNVPTQKNP